MTTTVRHQKSWKADAACPVKLSLNVPKAIGERVLRPGDISSGVLAYEGYLVSSEPSTSEPRPSKTAHSPQ